jgi:hypothetical protein
VGSEGIAPPFLTSALDEGEWSASCLGHFDPGERAPSTLRIGGWVGPRTELEAVEDVQPVACRYTDSAMISCDTVTY